MKKGKKLSLKKEKISSLTNSDMQSITGGKQIDNGAASTRHNFTCDWCTGSDNSTDCSTYTKITTGGQLTCVSCP
ncbi:class I lanthipeptide [Chryseobacterium camelliae]|uniref:class I lanthipeptide n=1 Tax=Chryseobacterium camelliae TaxID=1265445 RepID=UPI000C1C9B60